MFYCRIDSNNIFIPSISEGLAISNNTMPVSRSRILKRTKSILYTLASGAHRYPATTQIIQF